MAKRRPLELDFGPQPPADDVEANAQFIMNMLDGLGQTGHPDFLRIRSTLIDILVEYRDSARDDAAKALTKAKMLGAEMGCGGALGPKR